MIRRRLLLLEAALYSLNVTAQYHGGNNDGFTLSSVVNNNPNPSIYNGGNNDGFSFIRVLNQNAGPTIYTGGSNDGFSSINISSQNAGPSIYKGGTNDGFSFIRITNQNAGPSIYKGGNNDGFSSINISSQNAGPSIYKGGTNDGFSFIRITNQNAGPSIYKGGNNDGWSTQTLSKQNPTVSEMITLSLRMLIQGYYLGGGMMQAPDPINFPSLCDTVLIELHNNFSPYALAYSQKGTINTSGNGTFVIPAPSSTYYLAVKHRNALETWASSPVFMNSAAYYDFTTSPFKAYGANMTNAGAAFNESPIWAFYSGDISDASLGVGYQDGVIESQDYSDMENAVYMILSGYIPEDITGDGVVESLDYSIMENNVYYTIFVIHP